MTKRSKSGSKAAPRSERGPRRDGRGRPRRAATPTARPRAQEHPDEDPVVTVMLEALADAEALSARDIAERIAAGRARPGDGPDPWRRYFTAVKQRALNLAREGRIEILRKGRVADPSDFKGIVRYRLAQR